MKLLSQTTASGKTQVCSARCYAAQPGGNCSCICGGRNHAVGITKALENVRTLFLDSGKVTRAAERAIERAKIAKKLHDQFEEHHAN